MIKKLFALIAAAGFAAACSSSNYCSSAASAQTSVNGSFNSCADAGVAPSDAGAFNQTACENAYNSSACSSGDRTNLDTAQSKLTSCLNTIPAPACTLSGFTAYDTAAQNCDLDAGAAINQVSGACLGAFVDAGF